MASTCKARLTGNGWQLPVANTRTDMMNSIHDLLASLQWHSYTAQHTRKQIRPPAGG